MVHRMAAFHWSPEGQSHTELAEQMCKNLISLSNWNLPKYEEIGNGSMGAQLMFPSVKQGWKSFVPVDILPKHEYHGESHFPAHRRNKHFDCPMDAN